jgi:hypothetical protein
MTTFVDEYESAINNVEINDDSLVRMFQSCTDTNRIVQLAMDSEHERAVRLSFRNFDFKSFRN